jgi:hypothetical protein
LPALAPAASTSVTLSFTAPVTVGDYTMTVGLADANGIPLASAGAATGSFSLHVHVRYLVASVARLPQLLHRSEASMLIVQYSNLPAAGPDPHTYSLFWRATDPTTNQSVATGTSPLGSAAGAGGGTFFSLFNAPALRGTYKIAIELREGGVAVSDTQSITVEIAGPRSYPDDRSSATQPAPRGTPAPRPSGTPATPRPSPSGSPRGRASPTPPR